VPDPALEGQDSRGGQDERHDQTADQQSLRRKATRHDSTAEVKRAQRKERNLRFAEQTRKRKYEILNKIDSPKPKHFFLSSMFLSNVTFLKRR
jgi:hypothetical protein